jgi:hypothetical protein
MGALASRSRLSGLTENFMRDGVGHNDAMEEEIIAGDFAQSPVRRLQVRSRTVGAARQASAPVSGADATGHRLP